MDISDERLGDLWRMPDHYMRPISFGRAVALAARVQALEPMSDEDAVSLGRTASTNNTYSGGRFLTALFNRDALIGFVRAIEAHHAIRLLGEDAGKP